MLVLSQEPMPFSLVLAMADPSTVPMEHGLYEGRCSPNLPSRGKMLHILKPYYFVRFPKKITTMWSLNQKLMCHFNIYSFHIFCWLIHPNLLVPSLNDFGSERRPPPIVNKYRNFWGVGKVSLKWCYVYDIDILLQSFCHLCSGLK